MSCKEVSCSPVVESGLGTVVSLESAWTDAAGANKVAMRWPARAAVPATTAPVIKARRFRYVAFGVISEDGMSLDLRISMEISKPYFCLTLFYGLQLQYGPPSVADALMNAKLNSLESRRKKSPRLR